MTPSPRPTTQGWADHAPEAELLVQDPLAPAFVPHTPHGRPRTDDEIGRQAFTEEAFESSRSYADDSLVDVANATEYSTLPGMPGRGIIVTSLLGSGACVGLDFALTGGLTMFFDLCFVVICLIGAMGVRRRDLFTTGVLAPLAFGGTIAVIAIVSPTTFSAGGDFGTVFPTGLTAHAGALVAGYAVALVTVAGRVRA